MPRYFFDIDNNGFTRDEQGQELDDHAAARLMALNSLPRIAADEIGSDADRSVFTVLVTDDDGQAVYSAALSFVGQWLLR